MPNLPTGRSKQFIVKPSAHGLVQTRRQKMAISTTYEVPTVSIDINDAAFLAVLVTQYIAKGNNTDHLHQLVTRLTPKAGC